MTKSQKIAKALGALCGIIFITLLFGGLFALFTNWILSFIFVWDVTLKNWLITWGVIIVIKVILNSTKSKKV